MIQGMHRVDDPRCLRLTSPRYGGAAVPRADSPGPGITIIVLSCELCLDTLYFREDQLLSPKGPACDTYFNCLLSPLSAILESNIGVLFHCEENGTRC